MMTSKMIGRRCWASEDAGGDSRRVYYIAAAIATDVVVQHHLAAGEADGGWCRTTASNDTSRTRWSG